MTHLNKTKILAVIITIFFSCSQIERYDFTKVDNTLESKFEVLMNRFTEDSLSSSISLDNLTSYKWDKVFIIFPYTPIEKLEKITEINFASIKGTQIVSDEVTNLLVFVKNNEVVKYCDLPRSIGNFKIDIIDAVLVFTPENAIFELVKTNRVYASGETIIEVVPLSSNYTSIKW